MMPDNEGFLQPIIDPAKCIHCGKCENVCPVLHHGEPRKPIAVYAARAKDDKLRAGSASGGIFTLLALDVLKRGGVVFGAGFDHFDWQVIHKAAHNENELDDLRGSKYVQSDVGDTYKEAKQLLDNGTEVLYSGCPCQIAGLLNYLGKPYHNLITVDLICHGVPSPLAWRKYLDDRESEAGAKITRTLTRRYCGWQEYAVSFSFENGTAYSKSLSSDPFLLSYLKHWDLRQSCCVCQFRKFSSKAMVTIGDFWNPPRNICQEIDDHGLSAVMIHSLDAQQSLLRTKEIELRDVSIEDVSKNNFPIYDSPRHSRLRKHFYGQISRHGFDATVQSLSQKRESSIIMHLLWWAKRLVFNFEVNRF